MVPALLLIVLIVILTVHLSLFRNKRAGIDYMADLLDGVENISNRYTYVYVSVIPDNTEAYFSSQFVLAPNLCLRTLHPDLLPLDSLGVMILDINHQSQCKEFSKGKVVLLEKRNEEFILMVYKKKP